MSQLPSLTGKQLLAALGRLGLAGRYRTFRASRCESRQLAWEQEQLLSDLVVAPGDNFTGAIDALIERAFVVVVDASSQFTIAEARMAFRRVDGRHVLLISDNAAGLPSSELLVNPLLSQGKDFSFVYRAGMGVSWKADDRCLVAPARREWSCADWFARVIAAVEAEYGDRLEPTAEREWSGVEADAREAMERRARESAT